MAPLAIWTRIFGKLEFRSPRSPVKKHQDLIVVNKNE
jgi:hypothetical protein